jgi:hypothetical protein
MRTHDGRRSVALSGAAQGRQWWCHSAANAAPLAVNPARQRLLLWHHEADVVVNAWLTRAQDDLVDLRDPKLPTLAGPDPASIWVRAPARGNNFEAAVHLPATFRAVLRNQV